MAIIGAFVVLFILGLNKFVECDGVMHFDISLNYNEDSAKLGTMCANNRTKCTDQQTCCQTKHKSYHCCRYANAVCCPDKFHCCPHGTTCDTEKKRCSRRIETISAGIPKESREWSVKENIPKVDTHNQVCPNNRTKCQDSQTCCVTKDNSYHCCKFENAVCCSDKFHCCPADSTCDLKRHKCVKSNNEMLQLIPSQNLIVQGQLMDSLEAQDEIKVDKDQTCPNNKTKCKDIKTCCITKHGNYYCCPHKNAVCCSDKYQCCPEATTCDLKNKKCVSSSFSQDMHQSIPDVNMDNENLLVLEPAHPINSLFYDLKLGKKCPNSKLGCPGHKNCCVMDGGKFGCCKFNKGVCCPDLKTCCAHGTECDVAKGKCVSNPLNLLPL